MALVGTHRSSAVFSIPPGKPSVGTEDEARDRIMASVLVSSVSRAEL